MRQLTQSSERGLTGTDMLLSTIVSRDRACVRRRFPGIFGSLVDRLLLVRIGVLEGVRRL